MINKVDQDGKIILGGDFNHLMNPALDRMGGNHTISNNFKVVTNTLYDIMEQFNLGDIWRKKNPDTRRFTWKRRNPLVKSRLDYWLLSQNIFDNVETVGMEPSVRSDHLAISIQLKSLQAETKGKGYWKLNNSFINESDYIEGIIKEVALWDEQSPELVDPRMKWEFLKYKIRQFSLKYGKTKAKTKRNREESLGIQLNQLEVDIDQTGTEDIHKHERLERQISDVKTELKLIDDKAVEGLILRSGATWHENGEKSNAYFLQLETRNKIKKTIKKLEDENEDIVTDPKKIQQVQVNFYEKLYSTKSKKSPQDIKNYLQQIPSKTLNEQDKLNLDVKITFEECRKALKTFQKNKSPGNDGLTAEFYQKFWPIIGKYLMASIQITFKEGHLSTSQTQAVITLLDKGKDRSKLKNWRPISLLNVDYKIISKCLASRLKHCMPTLVHHNQVGYIQNRNITDNIRALADILECTKRQNRAGILLCIDFEKAFDSLEWNFLHGVLEKMNFGSKFIRWVKILYSGISSCVANNGHTTSYFKVERGVRQGDPLSPYLFTLAVEIMAEAIRKNEHITGIKLGQHEDKLLQYADDTTGILADVTSAKEFLKTVNIYGSFSGLKVNVDKTEAMWLGTKRGCRDCPLGIQWTDCIKVTGVYFSYKDVLSNEKNFDEKLDKIRNILNMWKQRDLTMIGRIQIVKTFIISQFTYVCSAVHIPEEYVIELNRLIWKFIWKGKKDRLKRKTMIQAVNNGGLKAPDIRAILKAAKVKWIHKYMSNDYHMWKTTFEWLLKDKNIDVTMLLKSNFKVCKQMRLDLPLFYGEVLDIWSKVGNIKCGKDNIIWYNWKIKIDGESVYYKELDTVGIRYVQDLYNVNGSPIPFQTWVAKGLSKSKFLAWYGLIKKTRSVQNNNITVNRKEDCREDLVVQTQGRATSLVNLNTKHVYEALICGDNHDNLTMPRVANMLTNCNIDWRNIYNRAQRMSVNVKTREFQYKFLNDLLPTNYWLHKWKIRENNTCTFCETQVETLEHLFYDCVYVRRLWKSVQLWYSNIEHLVFDKEIVFLGSESPLLHTVIMTAKQYVFSCKCLEKVPVFNGFYNRLNQVKKYELYSADIWKKLNSIEKWTPIELLYN